MTPLLYFHGLGSGADSRKYQLVKESCQDRFDVHCVTWNDETDFRILLFNLYKRYLGAQTIVIMDDSTGGNYACQFRDLMLQNGLNTALVLLNPLLSIDQRIAEHAFPSALLDSLVQRSFVDNCFLLLSEHDEVLSYDSLEQGAGVNLLRVDDSHRLWKFEEHLVPIQLWLERELQLRLR